MFFKLKSSLLIVLFILLATAVWTQNYLESQNFLLKNPNWYSYRSTFVDSYATTYQISMSRLALSSHELNLRTAKVADMILSRHQIVLRDLKFDFRIFNNSYLDILYNFDKGVSSFFRLSRTDLQESGIYKIDKDGLYTKFQKINFQSDSEGAQTAYLKQTDKGISLFVNGKLIGESIGEKFEKKEFGFESGLVGTMITNVKAFDSNGLEVGTSLDNNSFWSRYFFKNLLIAGLVAIIILGVSFSFKKNGLKLLQGIFQFIFLLGALWFVFDFYYYSKKEVQWDQVTNNTKFFSSENDDVDFEIIRWHFFSSWARFLGDTPLKQSDYEERFGVFFKNYPLDYCSNDVCSSYQDKEKNINLETNKKTIRLAMIGSSDTTSSGIRPSEKNAFNEMHKAFYDAHKNEYNVESFNFSGPSLKFINDKDELLEKVLKNKIDKVTVHLKIRESSGKKEFQAFGDFIKKCHEAGVKVIFIREPINPDKIVYLTSKQLKNAKDVRRAQNDLSHSKLDSFFEEQKQYGLTIVNPDELFFDKENIKKGKIWWDAFHFTSYGHKLFGEWIAKEIK